jgi:acetyltransferase-like isoleucine patch superfamily enzyme
MDLWLRYIYSMKTGVDVRISDKADIKSGDLITVGSHVSIDQWVYISTAIDVGNYVHIAPHVCVIGGVTGKLHMGNFSNIGAGSKIVVISDDFTDGMINPIIPLRYRNTIGEDLWIGQFATIGVNCTVLPNCHMAQGSVLGANSLLTKPTEPWGIYVGSPARKIGVRKKEWILESAKELGYEV